MAVVPRRKMTLLDALLLVGSAAIGMGGLSDEVFMHVGLAVAAVWFVHYASDRWRRPADWIDRMGVAVGALWILIGFVWTVREYIDFV